MERRDKTKVYMRKNREKKGEEGKEKMEKEENGEEKVKEGRD